MVSRASKNIEDTILQERFRYMTQPNNLHKTIKRWIDEADYDTDTGKLTEMIIQEVRNVQV